jgi:hypothetical protein
MEGLRLFGKCNGAARHFSARGTNDVLVICADCSSHVYVQGEELELSSFAAPMPLKPPGEPAIFSDMTPIEVRLGRWNDETEKFAPNQIMSVEDFLGLAS